MNLSTHLHITTWVIGLIFVFVTYAMYSSGSKSGAKIVHMILRLIYLLIIATGADLLFRLQLWNGEYISKAILGIISIGFMEMLLIRRKKQKSTTGMWIAFIIAIVVTIALGLRLQLGFKLF
ncbi:MULTISPECIES: YisL family protein [Bacillus]|uniref:UPF0344 protein AM592_03100 n=1 Tax=Bacillus gobiensis TaxID=1441095 RepID=A0A0M3R925_9BACI|nr:MULTISPECIES: YisL family protein [Bacillus]ALC80686.1 hypothetical protein AM592_03100 [Bacillus gobiensis]MED1094978.1 YisL family protein [Bacillus capparidis]